MTTITEQIHFEMLERDVATFDEIVDITRRVIRRPVTRSYVSRKFLSRLQKDGKVRNLRRGLYYAVLPSRNSRNKQPDRMLIASRVRPDGFIGYHTAIEFYGSAHSLLYNQAYTCILEDDRFRPFSVSDVRFRPVIVSDSTTGVGWQHWRGTRVRVSSRERTLIDCVERPEYCGGWEELLYSALTLREIRFNHLMQFLKRRDNQVLLRRVGLVLETLRQFSPIIRESISESQLERMASEVKGPPRYLFGTKERTPFYGGRRKLDFDHRWNLYVPEWFRMILSGGYR